ncbi:MAG TPA: FGGY-family carbohydrate kinase [Candidatus Brocadiia bacterium]|nr:FGGY-family carbohydrate kinase [Candidatus Brocadiia bacterium]
MFIGLDLGTTNVKALAVGEDGRVAARASAAVRLIHTPDGGVEQDIEEIWAAALEALEGLAARVRLADIEAIGVSSQGGALQMLDKEDRPLGRVVSWLDPRGRRLGQAMTERMGSEWFARRVGHGAAAVAAAQLLRLREEQPGWVAAPNRAGFVGDVIVGRLCGRRAHDATSLSLAILYNPWLNRADPEWLDMLGMEEARLPDLLPATTAAGGLRPGVAARLGARAGTPVSPAIHDQYASALGAGAVEAGSVMFGAGTAWVTLAVTDRLAAPVIPQGFSCSHVAPGLFGQMLSLGNGGSAFDWARRLMGLKDARPETLDEMMGRVPAGSEGLRFWPFVAAAPAGVAPGATGRLAGLQLRHGPGHVLRAVAEGLAFELARYLRFYTSAGIEVERLVMTGGAASSQVTPGIVAGVTGAPVSPCVEPDASALGAAILARALARPGESLAGLAARMTGAREAIEPGPERAIYARLLEEYVGSLAVR